MKTLTLLLTLLIALAGCQEENKVWGTGTLAPEWTELFGDDNTARLDWVQTQRINQSGQQIAEINVRLEKLEDASSD